MGRSGGSGVGTKSTREKSSSVPRSRNSTLIHSGGSGRPRKVAPHIEASEVEWATFAGFFSGEGNIGLGVGPTQRSPKRNVQVIINVVQARREPLEWIQHRFGGVLHEGVQGKGSFSSGKTKYVWRVSNREGAIQLLKGMMPYLITKQEEAKLALRLMEPGTSLEQQLKLKAKIRALRRQR